MVAGFFSFSKFILENFNQIWAKVANVIVDGCGAFRLILKRSYVELNIQVHINSSEASTFC